MKLFELDRINYVVHPTEEALLLKPFSDIWKRDKTKSKEVALKEFGFVWFYCDAKSQFLIIEEPIKTKELIKDLNLPTGWKADKIIKSAIEYYNSHKSELELLYEGALTVASVIRQSCMDSKTYLEAADDKIAAAQKLNSLLKELPTSMAKLKDAEKQFIKEAEENSGKKKGSQTYNTFEDMDF